jgi:hypothetical protein
MWTSAFLVLAAIGAVCAGEDKSVRQPDSVAATNKRLEEVLQGWQNAAESVRQAHYSVRTTSVDPVIARTEVSRTEQWFRKPDLLRIDLKNDNGSRQQCFYSKGKEVHWFRNNEEAVYNLSSEFGFPDDPGRYPDSFWPSLGGKLLQVAHRQILGFSVPELKKNCDVRLVKEDAYWIYLEFIPRERSYQQEFSYLRVVLDRKELWVRQITSRNSNGSSTIYDNEKPDTTTPVTPESITKGLPVGWKRSEDPGLIPTPPWFEERKSAPKSQPDR